MTLLRDQSGKAKIKTILWLLVLAVVVYVGIEVGGVYLRRLSLSEKIGDQLAYAGQLADETIRQQLVAKIQEMNLPPEASRVRLRRTGNRTIQVSVSYTETVNLFFTTRDIPISITKSRRF